jgi:hypothetical protein
MTIDSGYLVGKSSKHDGVVEFGGDLYLVEGGRGRDYRNARERDLIESGAMKGPIANGAISCGSGSSGVSSPLPSCTRKI